MKNMIKKGGLVLGALVLVFGISLFVDAQNIKNIQMRQQLFELLSQNKPGNILTQSGRAENGEVIPLGVLRLAPKPIQQSVDSDATNSSRYHSLLHVVGSSIFNSVAVFNNSRFAQGLYVGLSKDNRLNGSSVPLQVNGAVTIKELADASRPEPEKVCVSAEGVVRTCREKQSEYVPLDWDTPPERRCENGKVIAYIGVKGNGNNPVQFRREGESTWHDSNINEGRFDFKYEIPKHDGGPTQRDNDQYCKSFYYRVPGMGVDSVWGCVDTMTHTECPDL